MGIICLCANITPTQDATTKSEAATADVIAVDSEKKPSIKMLLFYLVFQGIYISIVRSLIEWLVCNQIYCLDHRTRGRKQD